MLQSANLIQLLVGCDGAKIDIQSIPVIENPRDIFSQQFPRRSDELEGNSSPFKFTPQRIRLDKDDEYFVVRFLF